MRTGSSYPNRQRFITYSTLAYFADTSHQHSQVNLHSHLVPRNSGAQGDIYEVANVINSRNDPQTGELSYLVEWKGYEGTDEHTSWEPKDNLVGSEDSIQEFRDRYPNRPSTTLPKQRLQIAKRRRTGIVCQSSNPKSLNVIKLPSIFETL